jgi:hypothetical protein
MEDRFGHLMGRRLTGTGVDAPPGELAARYLSMAPLPHAKTPSHRPKREPQQGIGGWRAATVSSQGGNRRMMPYGVPPTTLTATC